MKTSPCLARSLPAPGLRPSRRLWGVMLAALLALGAALSARAQSAGDPPGRVARLSDVAGQVWLYNADSEEWITVERNRPLTTGDRIATDNGARAEITLGSTTLRLDATTEIEIAPPRRHPLQRAPARRQRRGAPAQPAGARRIRARHRRRALSRPDRRPLPLRPLRRDQRRHGLRRPGRLRGAQHRAAGPDRAARAVLDRRRRRAAVRDGGAAARRVLRAGTTSATAPRIASPRRASSRRR